MKVPLPNLDDLRWVDLVDEGRSLIPLYAPDWTDHNVHDPGITLMELFAWVTEMDIYELNRISDEHKRKFLALVGISPFFPGAAKTVLGFNFKNGPQPPHFEASTEFSGKDPFGEETRFRTLDRVDLVKGELKALQVKDSTGFHDVTELWRRGEAISIFGAIPERGAELYLGFTHAFPTNQPATLYFKLAGPYSSAEARRRLIEEEKARRSACRPPSSDITCKRSQHGSVVHVSEEAASELPAHHGARVVWEFLSIDNEWTALTGASQLNDDTRSLTLDGGVIVAVPGKMGQLSVGQVPEPLHYLRSRFDAGDYDAPPSVEAVVLNGVRAVQSTSVSVEWLINSGVVPNGPSPAPMQQTALRLRFDANRHITDLDFTKQRENDPLFTVLAYVPPTAATAGRLAIEARLIGRGTGLPNQVIALREAPVSASSLQVFTLEEDVWQVWRKRNDFDASSRRDAAFVLEPDAREVVFGDGEKGRVPPRDSLIFATYHSTRAENGNLEARAVYQLVDSLHNRALFPNFDVLNGRFRTSFKVTDSALASLRSDGVPESVLQRLDDIKDKEILEEAEFTRALKIMLGEEQANRYGQPILKHTRIRCDLDNSECMVVSNPVAAEGGTPAETLSEASGRAVKLMSEPHRAVTLADYETLAKRTPGTRIARTAARANLHPNFTCLKAPGVITVAVLPDMPVARPTSSPGLKRAVARYLDRRRIIGTRVEVVSPDYLEIAVEAKVKAHPGVNRDDLQQRIANAINVFLDPFNGGPEGTGWPFGRDVFRSEILQVIDELEGVDYIASLSLIADGCDPQCGNVCLPPTSLVTAGHHEIEVF